MDAIEDTVDEAAGLTGTELLGDLDGLVDDHLRRRLHAPSELVHRKPKDVAIHDGHAIEVPVLGEACDDVVDVRVRRHGATHQVIREFPRIEATQELLLQAAMGHVGAIEG